jgi:hypothetical protein
MEAKRRALGEIGARQCAADEKRKDDDERHLGCGGLSIRSGSVAAPGRHGVADPQKDGTTLSVRPGLMGHLPEGDVQ